MKQKLFHFFQTPIVPALVISLIVRAVANAQVQPAPTITQSFQGLQGSLFCPIYDVMFWVLISISVIMVLWAAFLYTTSEGESEKPSQARRMILYAAVGIVLALIAKGFPDIVGSLFPAAGGDAWITC